MKRHPEDGFTLIEALVAMAILATAAISLLGAAEQHVSRINGLQDRILARWVAEDRLTARSLGLQESSETVELMGRRWEIREDEEDTSDPALRRLTIRVSPEGGDPLIRLIGFIDTEAQAR